MSNITIQEVSEQIQQDILSFIDCVDPEKSFITDQVLDELCQIVVNNMTKLNK